MISSAAPAAMQLTAGIAVVVKPPYGEVTECRIERIDVARNVYLTMLIEGDCIAARRVEAIAGKHLVPHRGAAGVIFVHDHPLKNAAIPKGASRHGGAVADKTESRDVYVPLGIGRHAAKFRSLRLLTISPAVVLNDAIAIE